MTRSKKLKICDFNGAKLDSVAIDSDDSVKRAIERWKKKGLF